MKISEYHSHLNGLEFLIVKRKGLWEEVETIIKNLDFEKCKIKNSDELDSFNLNEFQKIFIDEILKYDWKRLGLSKGQRNDDPMIPKTLSLPADEQKKQIVEAGEGPIYSYNQTDFVKDRVAVEVQFGKYSFVAYDLFVKHLAFYVGDHIDVGIEILPMKKMQSYMSSGVAYYEGEFYNVVRHGRGVPAVPLVLVGIEP